MHKLLCAIENMLCRATLTTRWYAYPALKLQMRLHDLYPPCNPENR